MSNKETKGVLTPKLRFPEFQDDWERFFGNQIFDNISNKDHDSSLPVLAITQEHGAIPRNLIDYQVYVTNKSVESYKVVEIGDFIISLRSFQGGIEYSRYKGICSPAYIILRKKTDISEPYFKYFFKTERFIQELQKNLEGLRDGKMVSYQQFSELLLPTPSTDEQQKIADCLTSLDELIFALRGKRDALKTYKKGLLQNLFPAEGETLPRLRFPEFQDAGEWGLVALGSKVTKVGSGITPKGGESNYKNKGRSFIRSQNVGWGELILDDVAFIDDATHATFLDTEIKDEDVLLNITGASIGRSAIADSRIRGGNVNQHVCIIRSKAKELNPRFLNQYLLSQYGQKQVDSFQAGGNRQGLNFAQVRSFSIPIPQKVDEQIKIAEFLLSIDGQITAQREAVEMLKAHKKGLMQGLFLSMDGVQ